MVLLFNYCLIQITYDCTYVLSNTLYVIDDYFYIQLWSSRPCKNQ